MPPKIPTAHRTQLQLNYQAPPARKGLPKEFILKSLIGSATAALAAVIGVAGLCLIQFEAPWQIAVPIMLLFLFGPNAVNSVIISNFVQRNYPASNRAAWNHHLQLQLANTVAVVAVAMVLADRLLPDK